MRSTLVLLGFDNVVDVDEEAGSSPKREDLQIQGSSPVVLVEVKGIAGMPSDDDILQAAKYVAPRIKEWKRMDVRALCVLNHQRHVPPLDRDYENVFRADILANAQQHDLGLITTWDLYKLARGLLRNGWKHASIRNLFFQSGRVPCLPSHYEDLGAIEEKWERAGAIGVRLLSEPLVQGERLGIPLDIDFVEFEASSLQLESVTVKEAPRGSLVGIKLPSDVIGVRKAMKVFRAKPG